MNNEIDLHGYEVLEAIDIFVESYNAKIKAGDFSQMNVIHGYGSGGEGGKIKLRLRNFLANHTDNLEFVFGENIPSSNPGQTVVFPRRPLPSRIDLLSEEILKFCDDPKTKTKIFGKFRRHGTVKIQTSLDILENHNLLSVSYKGMYKLYCRNG
ncbi:MAG: Smr/MutS family protein [Candidatus Riflebacteria bacterium]|nr:Smr/MutS family protein [Candidatus Riflebacteria bacterium]